MAGLSLADAISARAQQSSENSATNGNTPGGDFASQEMASHFADFMSILCLLLSLPTEPAGGGGGSGLSVPPDLVRRALSVLEAAHGGGGLFRFPPFGSAWLRPLLTEAIKGLGEGAHPLLQEEVRRLVFDMAEVGWCLLSAHVAIAAAAPPHPVLSLASVGKDGVKQTSLYVS